MKKYFYTFFWCFSVFSISAQSSNEVGKIALSIVIPDNIEGLNSSNLSKLETKIIQLVTQSGLAANGYSSNFIIYPKLAIYDDKFVEGGMEDIFMLNCELTLILKQLDNNVIYSTSVTKLKGSGVDKQIAFNNAISKINSNSKEFVTFIETGKQKIIDYYNLKCQDIITKSESLVKMQDYEGAIGLLMTVPEEVSCYNKIQQKTIEAYKAYQNQKCSTQLQEAKTTLAKNYYKDALDILSQIDPSTKCYKEVEALIKKAEEKVDAKAKTQFAVRMKMYNDSIALEKQRIQAAKEIAVEYYRNQPKPAPNNYLMIIK
ncbi:hypothetical protein [uncultured Flavobacterium sp.]|uniref:hypothetical protein n=1 Tax=uncultured Flavobacterium sp. TaxID=165435 RepID=UPI002622CE17|nr:hypothetical protein [uncultured Flavobacterium sp.]